MKANHCLKCSACLAVAVGLALVASGCTKKSTASADASPGSAGKSPTDMLKPVNPDDSLATQEKARQAIALAMRRGDPPPAPAVKLAGGETATPEILAAYNQELLRVRIQERRSPESLEDLVQKWINRWRLLPALPTPPPGKRVVYDDANCIIRLDPP